MLVAVIDAAELIVCVALMVYVPVPPPLVVVVIDIEELTVCEALIV